MSVGAEGREGTGSGAHVVGFLVALVPRGDPDPSGSRVLSQEGRKGPLPGLALGRVVDNS